RAGRARQRMGLLEPARRARPARPRARRRLVARLAGVGCRAAAHPGGDSATIRRVTTDETIAALDRGELRVAEPAGDDWVVHPEVQEAILDYFRSRRMEPREVGPFEYLD